MAPGSTVRATDLVGLIISLEVASVLNGGVLSVRLVKPPPKVEARLRVVRIPAERLSRNRDIELAFPPIGESELERMVAAGDPGVIGRIDDLKSKKDDPIAWWTLALGHRSDRIRRPINAALVDIGIERIDRMLRQSFEFDWDPDLLDFVGEEMAKPRSRGGLYRPLASDRSGWDKPWWADD